MSMTTIESGLRRRCPDSLRDARGGGISFVQRFGSTLDAHTHMHCCVSDGLALADARLSTSRRRREFSIVSGWSR
jgi:hypothetical protein